MKRFIFIILVLGLLAGLGYVAFEYAPSSLRQGFTLPQGSYMVPELSKEYSNTTYHFSLKMPEDFEATKFEDEFGTAVVLQDQSGNGVQILISPFGDEDIKELTQERIKQDLPDMLISEAQTVEIGDEYKGLAFKSDNEFFGGASREVWFVYQQNLYQISTYARLDELLQKIFTTWQFN